MNEQEQRKAFREEFHFHTDLQTRLASAYEDRAVNFSMLVIKTGMILNGGAVAALTPLLVALGANLRASFWWLVSSLLAFSGGLILSWLGGTAGYFAVVQGGLIIQQDLRLYHRDLFSRFANLVTPEDQKRVQMAAENIDGDKEHTVYDRWRTAGIFLVMGGFVFFLLGVGLTVFLLFDLVEANQAGNSGIPGTV